MSGGEPGDQRVNDQDAAFARLYGETAALRPGDVAGVLGDFDRPWWVVGGWAVEAFAGVSRPHHDVDVAIFRGDLPALRRAVEGRLHIWSAGSRMLRPVDEHFPEPHPESEQVWLREHALAPWLLDVQLNPADRGRWVNRRWPDHVADLDDVTWVASDGIRYLAPEIALLFKARHRRPHDDADLAHALPLFTDTQRTWLHDALARHEPTHPWLARLR